MVLTCFLTFGECLANFERPVLGCIETNLCKQILVGIAVFIGKWKALDEIYKIYKLLHRSAFKISAKFRQTFSHFYRIIFKISLIFRNSCPNVTNFDDFFPEFQQIGWKRSKSPRILKFPEISKRKLLNFQKMIVEK